VSNFSESVVEEAALAWLEGLGYEVLYGPSIAADEPAAERTDPHIRILSSNDSINELTSLLHRAYAHLGALGLNFTAVDQSPEVTAQRVNLGTCYVAVVGTELVGTIVVRGTHKSSECSYFNQPGVATAHQFAVAPEYQGTGIGSALLSQAEAWARKNGFSQLVLDTAESVTDLIEFYSRRGYEKVGTVQWPGKRYRSVVMRKALQTQV
jgi:GNAT superfamily N-acetyltransferase